MPWQPMHMAILASPALALPGTSCAWAEKTVAEATVKAINEDNKAFILRAQSN
jgi:hypothetical protein